VALSPDGRQLAALTPVGGKRNLVVLDLDTMKPRVVTNYTVYDIVEFHWVGERLVFSLGQLDVPSGAEFAAGGGWFSVKSDGTEGIELVPVLHEAGYQMSFAGLVGNSAEHIVLQGAVRDASAIDLYRMNVRTGGAALMTSDRPGAVFQWVVDANGVPRAAVVLEGHDKPVPQPKVKVFYRASRDDDWQLLQQFSLGGNDSWHPVAMAPNDRDLIVSVSGGRDTSALARFDVERGTLAEIVAAHPRYDVGLDSAGDLSSTLLRDATGNLIGLRIADERLQTVYFDEQYAALQAGLEAAFPGRAVLLQRAGMRRSLVTVLSDRQPETHYLFDESTRRLTELLRSSEQLGPAHLAAVRPFLLKTRDGLEIPSYLVLPNDHEPGQRLPTVIHVHGGPFVRADHWSGGPGIQEAQLLASRGYAVVLPNFRITPGFGKKIFVAGTVGAFGRQMSDDHDDAADWAVQQGFADPNRICISGSSYGGYAALWALIRSKPRYQCAVAGMVISDLEMHVTSMAGALGRLGKLTQSAWRDGILGVDGKDWSKAHAVSPAKHAQNLEGALFMYAGREDLITPMEQTQAMVRALKRAGKAPEVLLVKDDEGHGYGKVANRVDLYEKMLAFLDKHIGPGSLKK
jgi:dipeptidyl aminopeptidase/acylaminoacyl peptidase